MADGELKAKFGIDDSEFQEGMRKLAASIGNLSDNIQDFGSRASSGLGSAGDASDEFQSHIKALMRELGPIALAIESFEKVKEAISGGMEEAEKADTAYRKLQFSVEKMGGASHATFTALVDWTERYAKSLNLLYTPEQLENSESQLKTLGLTTDQIKNLLPQVVDLAQATGGDLNSATKMAADAIMGHGRALKEVGISLENTHSKTKNLAELQKQLAKFTGEAASQLDSYANKDKEMSNQIDEDEKEIGAIMLPLWQSIKKGFLDAADAAMHFKSTQDVINDNANKATDAVIQNMNATQMLAYAQAIYNKESKETDPSKILELSSAYNHVLERVKELNAEAAKPSTEKTMIQTGNDKIADNNALPTDKIETFAEIAKKATDEEKNLGLTAAQVLENEYKASEEALKKLADAGVTSGKQVDDLKAGMAKIKAEQDNMVESATTFLEVTFAINEQVTSSLTPFDALQKKLSEIQDQFKAMGKENSLDELKAQMDAIKSTMEQMSKASNFDANDAQYKQLGSQLTQLSDQYNKIKTAAEQAKVAQQQFGQGVSSMATELGGAIATIAKGGQDVGKQLFGQLAKIVSEAGKKFGEKMIALGVGMNIAAPGSGMADIIGGGAIVAASTALGALKLAQGGIVSGSTFANIGEYPGANRNPEVVAPLDKLRNMIGGGDVHHMEARVSGDDLLFVTSRVSRFNQNSTGGGLGNY